MAVLNNDIIKEQINITQVFERKIVLKNKW